MTTFTSSLPKEILEELSRVAKEQNVPKNRILEDSLRIYFEELEKRKWAAEMKALANDPEIVAIAEEGMADYAEQLKKYD